MKDAKQIRRLMKLPLRDRTFVMEALARIEDIIEEHLYNCDDADEKNGICINLKDITYSVFETEKKGSDTVIKGWMSHATLQVPKELYQKSWRRIFKTSLFLYWGYLLAKELEAQGFCVKRENEDEKRCFLKIGWTEKEKSE